MTGRPSRPPRPRRGVLTAGLRALACAALVGCDMDPQAPAAPALVDVWVSSPEPYDQAFRITFDRPVEGFSAAPGFRDFQDAGERPSTVLVVAAEPMPAGESRVGSVRVRDLRDAASMDARVVDAARSDHALRETTAGYRVRLSW
jgi:hypothetical protein